MVEMVETADKPDDKIVKKSVVSIYDICETDVKAEEDGRWFKDIFGDGTNIDVCLRHITCNASINARRRIDRANRKFMVNGKYPDDIAVKLLIEQIAEAVLIGWRGILDRDGVEIPYSKEAAVKLLSELRVFRDGVVGMSQSMDSFRVEAREDTEKN